MMINRHMCNFVNLDTMNQVKLSYARKNLLILILALIIVREMLNPIYVIDASN
jgi:hypothetical protein